MKNKRHTHGGKRVAGPGKKVGRPLLGPKPKVKVSFSLDADLVKRFEQQARKKGLTKSDAIAQALRSWLPLDLNAILADIDQVDQELANDDQ